MSYLLLAVTFIVSLLLPASALHAGPVVAVKDFQGSGPSSAGIGALFHGGDRTREFRRAEKMRWLGG